MNELKNEDYGGQKKKNKTILVLSILLVLVIILGTVAYPLLVKSPKKVFTTAIDKITTLAKKDIEGEFPEKLKGKFSLKTDLTSHDTDAKHILDILNNIDLGITYQIDYDSQKMHVNMESSYKNKDLLNFDMIFQNDEAYMYLQNIYSKYLKVTTNGLEDLFSTDLNKKDYEIVVDELQKAFKSAMKDRYFTKETETINVNDKSKKVTKNSLLLNEENLSAILKDLLKKLNNEKFIKSYAQISSTSETEIKEMFNELEKDTNINLTDAIIISIYTEGLNNTFVGINISDNEDSLTILKINDNNYSYTLETEETKITGNLELQIRDTSFDLKMLFDHSDISGTIVLKFEYENDANIPNVDPSNVIDANFLTEEDQEEILDNFQKNEGLVELGQEFTKLFTPHLYDM